MGLTSTRRRPAPIVDGAAHDVTDWAPAIGQHTDAVLGEAGLSSDEIATLRSSATIA